MGSIRTLCPLFLQLGSWFSVADAIGFTTNQNIAAAVINTMIERQTDA